MRPGNGQASSPSWPPLPPAAAAWAEPGLDRSAAVLCCSPCGAEKGAGESNRQWSGTASQRLSGFVSSLKFRDNRIELAASRSQQSNRVSPKDGFQAGFVSWRHSKDRLPLVSSLHPWPQAHALLPCSHCHQQAQVPCPEKPLNHMFHPRDH